MQTNRTKISVSKFPLRLMPSVRRHAEEFSAREGVSLNQFINVAVAEKLAHLQHEQWLAQRPSVTAVLKTMALAAIDKSTGALPEKDDRLPPGYRRVRRAQNKVSGKK